jgi:predicted RNase H-like nuclease (RuvC/YqgF family)
VALAKSPSELTAELASLAEGVANLRHENAELKAKLARLGDDAVGTTRSQDREIADLRQELALLRQQLADHLKRTEESDRRLWTMIGLVVGAVLALAANLIVAWVRK